MRWMRWSFDDYEACPVSVRDRIIELIEEDHRRRQQEAEYNRSTLRR